MTLIGYADIKLKDAVGAVNLGSEEGAAKRERGAARSGRRLDDTVDVLYLSMY